jgi:Zn-dependent peptidase ImmA (M78 family)
MGQKRAKKLDGLCEFTTHTVYLADRDDPKDVEHAFVHELGHILEHTLGVTFDHDQLDAAAGIIHHMIESSEGNYNGKV